MPGWVWIIGRLTGRGYTAALCIRPRMQAVTHDGIRPRSPHASCPSRRHPRRRPHPVLPAEHGLFGCRQPGHVGADPRCAGRAFRPAWPAAGRSGDGRGDQAFLRLEPGSRGGAVVGPVAADPGHHPAARLRYQPGLDHHHRQQDRRRPDRIRYRRRLGHHLRRADRLRQEAARAPAGCQPREDDQGQDRRVQGLQAGRAQARVPRRGRAAHRQEHGRPLRRHGQAVEHLARFAGRVGGVLAPQAGRGV